MVKQMFDVEGYWKVIVYYNVDYNFFDEIIWEMKMSDFPERIIKNVWTTMKKGDAKAATVNNQEKHISLVLFNPHASKADYINSIVHEAEHVKQAMLKTYMVEDAGEPSAYTIGYIVMRMYEVFKKILSNP